MGKIDPVELEAITKRDPLAFGISYVDLLDNKMWTVNDRTWIKEIYQAVNPYWIEKQPVGQARRVALTKSTQAGITTMALVKALHFMCNWSVRVGHMLPRQKDLIDFSSTRLTPVIKSSPYLSGKLGNPDSVYTKKIGESYLFYLEGSVEPRSMPMDALYLDEVDLCDPDHVGTAMNRLDASPWQLITYLSTPTLPNYGIDAVYQASDQREWLVPCPHCGEKQPMDWEKNLAVLGPQNNPTKVYYMCASCREEINLADIQMGQWVAQHPALSEELIGFHISQMMTTPAPKLYSLFRDPSQSLAEFYRKRLGRPYTVAGGSLERDDFLVHCFDEPHEMEFMHDGKSQYYMGVDQGNQLQVVVGKILPGKTTPQLAFIEIVPFAAGFDRINDLMKIFKIRRAVIDGDPNRHPIKDMQKVYPGKVLMADYIEQRERFVVKKTEKVITNVTINRTEGFDDLVESIRKDWWALPGDPSNLPPQVELLIEQMTSIKRDVEKRKTPSGEIEVGVWRKLRADHLAHSMVYLKTAIEVERGRNFKSKTIGPPQAEPEVDLDKPYSPKQDVVVKLIAILAEVPKEQLRDFLVNGLKDGYEMPFPLSYKYGLVVAGFSPLDVIWAIKTLSVS